MQNKKKKVSSGPAIVRAAVKHAFWAAAESSVTSNTQISWTDHIKLADLMQFSVISLRFKINTRKVCFSKHQPLCVLISWQSEQAIWLTARLSFPPSLSPPPVSHFCRMFLLSWVPIVHTVSWLASQGCCWLLGPLIGSSCALASLARCGLACARSSQTTQGIWGRIFFFFREDRHQEL